MSTTATFVLSDVVGSTRRWSDEADSMPDALAALDAEVDDLRVRHVNDMLPVSAACS